MVYAKNKFAITGPSRKKMSEIDTCHLGTRHEVPVAAPTTVRFLRATPRSHSKGKKPYAAFSLTSPKLMPDGFKVSDLHLRGCGT